MEINQISMVVTGVGTFTVDNYMGVWFDDEEGVYWETHASMLNIKQYPSLYDNFKEIAKEEGTEYNLSFKEFCKILEKVFQMYQVIKG
ncbi:hypothetical protein FDI23_gp063 [Serratia phage CHI14]|uniref:Uncharacterized protein n=2 Tax=Winklervirus chi14 TaxID=2560752 RepID=A0A1Z1LY48_9CAUD|nr:hypothetical protein FDI23_gp063 [Serratia phage CHI14]ARW57486.1 hypothetical protein [Serratia phage CHI14]ARW57761.1 hypothetical protein [Serratia phage CBH8]